MRTRRKQTNQRDFLTMLPRCLTDAERVVVAENYRLAYGYVRRNGWRFDSVIDRDEQIAECLLKLCQVIEASRASAWNPDKARLSTFAEWCFYRHLSGLAKKRGRCVAVQFSQLSDGGDGFGYDSSPELNNEDE